MAVGRTGRRRDRLKGPQVDPQARHRFAGGLAPARGDAVAVPRT